MPNYLKLKNGVVVGVQHSPKEIKSPDYIETQDYNLTLLGKVRNEQGGFDDAPQPKIRKITYSAFLDRFSVNSLVAIESSDDVKVKVLEKKLQSKGQDRKEINLDDPKLIAGLQYYQSLGLLKEGDTPESLTQDGNESETA